MDIFRIEETLESFNLATHVPIIAVLSHENKVYSFGYNKRLHIYLKNHNIKNRLLSIMNKDKSISTATIMASNNVFFTASTICPRKSCKSIFIFGPYSYDRDNTKDIIHKPKRIIKHYIYLLDQLWKDHCPQKHKNLKSKPFSLHVKKAIDYIDHNYQNDLKLAEVCDYLNVSKCYFCSIFKKETGKTFTQFLNELRVDKSMQLLKDRKLSMFDIALSVGFNNQNYYNIIFKKITNKTPSQYRNSLLPA